MGSFFVLESGPAKASLIANAGEGLIRNDSLSIVGHCRTLGALQGDPRLFLVGIHSAEKSLRTQRTNFQTRFEHCNYLFMSRGTEFSRESSIFSRESLLECVL